MKKTVGAIFIIAMLASCSNKKETAEKIFTVSGTITNNTSRVIYLEEIPVTTMQAAIVDSSVLDKNGKYQLKTGVKEAMMYNLRLDRNQYPVATIINDAPAITLDVKFSTENNQFADSYEVKNSKSSLQLRDFMIAFNTKLQEIFYNSQQADSLAKAKSSDSAIKQVQSGIFAAAAQARELMTTTLKNSTNPALSMFVLSYYQNTANNPGYNLPPVDKQELINIVNETAAKFPEHQGVKALQTTLQGSVGRPAPEISLPDANGKEVKLSSFKGKYVLVDFWASWCGPCRMENPNVVKAYNRFKDKNFTILGVSLDKPGQKDEWMKAVMKDNLTWTQVSDLQSWKSPVVQAYKIEGIPFNVLVDPNGIIIGEALRGDDLERKLEEVLK
jgi:peroxiredoxin